MFKIERISAKRFGFNLIDMGTVSDTQCSASELKTALGFISMNLTSKRRLTLLIAPKQTRRTNEGYSCFYLSGFS